MRHFNRSQKDTINLGTGCRITKREIVQNQVDEVFYFQSRKLLVFNKRTRYTTAAR